jgi:hypothetical protein
MLLGNSESILSLKSYQNVVVFKESRTLTSLFGDINEMDSLKCTTLERKIIRFEIVLLSIKLSSGYSSDVLSYSKTN